MATEIKPTNEDIIARNQEALEKIAKRLDRIEKHFTWNTIFGFIKAVVIIGPIVFGVIYLSPFVKAYVDKLRPLFDAISVSSDKENAGQISIPAVNLDLLSPSVRSVFCDPQAREALVRQNCSTK